MSTRGAIARSTDLGWAGVYHHSDSYPTGLGAFLHDAYRAQFDGDLVAMQKVLLDDHPAGWSSVLGSDLRKPAGFQDPLVSYDPSRPRCYCHGDRSDPAELVQCQCVVGDYRACNALFIEYAYVLTEMGLEIWHGVIVPGEYEVPMPSGYQPPCYRHVLFRLVPWLEDMPTSRWEVIEQEMALDADKADEEAERLKTAMP